MKMPLKDYQIVDNLVLSNWENLKWKFGIKVLIQKNTHVCPKCIFVNFALNISNLPLNYDDTQSNVFGIIPLVTKSIEKSPFQFLKFVENDTNR